MYVWWAHTAVLRHARKSKEEQASKAIPSRFEGKAVKLLSYEPSKPSSGAMRKVGFGIPRETLFHFSLKLKQKQELTGAGAGAGANWSSRGL